MREREEGRAVGECEPSDRPRFSLGIWATYAGCVTLLGVRGSDGSADFRGPPIDWGSAPPIVALPDLPLFGVRSAGGESIPLVGGRLAPCLKGAPRTTDHHLVDANVPGWRR